MELPGRQKREKTMMEGRRDRGRCWGQIEPVATAPRARNLLLDSVKLLETTLSFRHF